jgi:hypothetical protein
MKYAPLFRQIRQLRAQLPVAGQTITIHGGLPADYVAPAAAPPGVDLQKQARAFKRPAAPGKSPAQASDAAEGPEVAPTAAKRA